jgi:hypothetical protein
MPLSAISWRPVLVVEEAGEPPTMSKQLVNFITCGCESSAPFFNNVWKSLPSSSTINIVSNYSTDQNVVTPSKDSKQLSTKQIASTQTRDKLTTLDYVTTTGHAGHETNMRLTNIKSSSVLMQSVL